MFQTVLLISQPGKGPTQHRFERVSDAIDEAVRLRDRTPQWAAAIHTATGEVDALAEQLLLVARAGQILLSESAASQVRPGTALSDLGHHRMRDLITVCRIFALGTAPENPINSLDTLLNNLPPQFTSFVGRERETELLGQGLSRERHVTITGPGGVGKTRLALQVAAAIMHRYDDGAWFIPLEGLSSPEQIPQAVASAIGLLSELEESQSESLLNRLKRACAQRQFLLVLDNCEHLINPCASFVRELMIACPRLSVLCTSREPLGIGGEVTVEVAPLEPVAAARLFQERASALGAGFAVTAENAGAISEICARLDGIPLAIELAAARTRVLPPAELADRLKDRFSILFTGDRLARPRHQTLRAAVDWSHHLLTEPEQILWRRLSVFAGGFTLEAAEAIVPDARLGEGEVLQLLQQLIDKSIVRVDRSGEGLRYAMLETIRDFGKERLVEAGEETAVRRRHVAWFASWINTIRLELQGPQQVTGFARVEQEGGNVQAALAWCQADDESAIKGLRIAFDLAQFWMRGRMREGLTALSNLLALPVVKGPSLERILALSAAGALEQFTGGDRAREYHEEAVALARAVGDASNVAVNLANLGQVAFADGRFEEALDRFTESHAILRSTGGPSSRLLVLNNLAYLQIHLGDLNAAGRLIDEALSGWRTLDYPVFLCYALERAGLHRVMAGRLDEARELLSEAVSIAAALQSPELTSLAAERISAWLLAKGRPEAAAHLLGAVAAIRTHFDCPRPGWDVHMHNRLVDDITVRLGAVTFNRRFAEGQSMSMEGVWLRAQELLGAPARAPAALPGGLTAREMEVVGMVAQGLPDREVANRLHLSRFTVNNHLRNIFGKLNLSSRAALVTWAFQHGVASASS